MNRDFYTKHEMNKTLNGLSFEKISQLEFSELLTKNPNTIYYVYDDKGKITQYMGDAELSSGNGSLPVEASKFDSGTPNSIIGTATKGEI